MASFPSVGIIVGRFQVPSIQEHDGYVNLFTQTLNKFDYIGIVLGCSKDINERNILTYEIRRKMITEYFDNIKKSFRILFIDKIYDEYKDNALWSNKLDSLIKHYVSKINEPKITTYVVGSRDSFLDCYYGEYEKCFINSDTNKADKSSGTKLREEIIKPTNIIATPDWNKGVLWGVNNISIRQNLIINTDSYKFTHWKMLSSDIEYIYSYGESRIGAMYPETVFFGLQYFLKQMNGSRVTMKDIDDAEELCKRHFLRDDLFNRAMWEHIVINYNGKLPLKIKAIPEGTSLPINNVYITIKNTDPKCPALTSHFESWLTHIWYPSNVATISRTVKLLLAKYLRYTSNDISAIDYMLHDFGYRGASSHESGCIGGAGHLVNFLSTDTLPALELVRKNYGETMTGFSIPASEHSIMTCLGKENEYKMIDDLLDKFPDGFLSLVLDSYSIYDAIDYLGTKLRDKVLERKGGKLMIRPDSGDPETVTIKVFELLDKYFGHSLNEKGFKLFPPNIGVVYGDGLDIMLICKILDVLVVNKWCVSNMVFGMGGGLLQKHNRDTQKNSFKCSANKTSDGIWHDVNKDPIEGADKKSKAGRLKLIKKNGKYMTVKKYDPEYLDHPDRLITVFKNGEIKKDWSFTEIRKHAQIVI